jgi:hypothetical protein
VFEFACRKSEINCPSRAVTPIWYVTCLCSSFFKIEIEMIIETRQQIVWAWNDD